MDKRILSNFIILLQNKLSTLVTFELIYKLIGITIILPLFKYNLILGITVSIIYFIYEIIFIIICLDKIDNKRLIKISFEKFYNILKIKNIDLIITILIILTLIILSLVSSIIGKIDIPWLNKSNFNLLLVFIAILFFIKPNLFRLYNFLLLNIKKDKKNSFILDQKNSYIYLCKVIIILNIIGYFSYDICVLIIAIYIKLFAETNSLKYIFVNNSVMFLDYYICIISIIVTIVLLSLIQAYFYKENNIYVTSNKKVKKHLIKKVLLLLLIVGLVTFEGTIFSHEMDNIFNIYFPKKTVIAAHRGACALAPENTMSALKTALSTNSEYIEIDVQETKDGEIVLLHDANLRRTTGIDKYIWDVSYEELKEYDAGSYFDDDYINEKIPTLDEVLKYSTKDIKFIIEIKQNNHISDNMIEKVINIINKNNMQNNCIIGSMDLSLLKESKLINSNIKTCYIKAILQNKYSNLDYIDIYSLNQCFLNEYWIEKIQSENKEVFVWTVNNPNNIRKFLELDVNGIITDNPFIVDMFKHKKIDKIVDFIGEKLF